MRTPPKVVVLGSMCRLGVPGVVYQILHYLVGLRDLGFDSYYVEAHGNWVSDPRQRLPGGTTSIAQVLDRHGFGRNWSCTDHRRGDDAFFGPLSPADVATLYRHAVAVLNVTGAHVVTEAMAACPTRIYVETDPGIPQIRLAEGDAHFAELLAGHTHHATFGELMGHRDCRLPSTGHDYVPTRQPVVLDMWSADPATRMEPVTTIARWRKAKDKSIAFRGSVYQWDKRAGFLEILGVPARTGLPVVIALSGVGDSDRALLEGSGWSVVDAMRHCLDADDYRSFIITSGAELTVAKDQYVRLRTGWFSDRSACYLAAGRPVVTQDTGFSVTLPTGAGLLAFQNEDEAVAALDELRSDVRRHGRAARRIAEEFFAADRVLTHLLERCAVDVPGRRGPRPSPLPASGPAAVDVPTGPDGEAMRCVASGRTAPAGWVVTPLRRDRVFRMRHGDVGSPLPSYVAKRVDAACDALLTEVRRELVRVPDLARCAAPLVGRVTVDGQVWHFYEDLGENALGRPPGGRADNSRPADIGFLSPISWELDAGALAAAVDLTAKLHRSFAGRVRDTAHLPPRGGTFVAQSIDTAVEVVSAAAADPAMGDTGVAAAETLLSELLDARHRLHDHGAALDALAPDTLVHGDLGLNNIVNMDGDVRLVDWDDAGVGPGAYDISTFLAQLAPSQRTAALERYLDQHGGDLPSPSAQTWNVAFDLLERGRIAAAATWPAAHRARDPRWAASRMAECASWFRLLGPIVPDGAVVA